MTTVYFRKGLVLAIIGLFIGAGFLPSISGNISKIAKVENSEILNSASDSEIQDSYDQNNPEDNGDILVYSTYNDVVDQSQYKDDVFMAISKSQGEPPQSSLSNAQSFCPSLNNLTKVNLFLYKNGSPDYNNIKVSIRDSQSTNDLVSTTKLLNNIPSGTNWLEFNFPDIEVTPDEIYYIVVEPSGGYWTFGLPYFLGWGCAKNDPYQLGDAWGIWDQLWWQLNFEYKKWDYCFETYGYDSGDQSDVIINSIDGGFRVSTDIINNGTNTATDIDWSIDLEGGLIIAGEHSEGVISELAAGATKTIRQTDFVWHWYY